MPDLFVYKAPSGPGELLEVKGTRISPWVISKQTLDKYQRHWKPAKFIIFSIPAFEIRVVPVEDLDTAKLPPSPIGKDLLAVDLATYGKDLVDYFQFDRSSYKLVMDYIAKETRHYLGGPYGLDL